MYTDKGKQKVQIPEKVELDDYDEDDADEFEELEELESFSTDCALSDEESAEEIERDEKIIKIESLAICLAVIEEIPTEKK
ncbi:1471_t:CDS:2, partial [Racocetra persica]